MSLPPSYSGVPGKEQHNHFRDVCIDLKKVIHSTSDLEQLEMAMERFMNASREVEWPHNNHNSGIYHKDEVEKATRKVWKLYKRYLEKQDSNVRQDFLNAIAEVETMIDQLKVR